jgi:hypothetical protein
MINARNATDAMGKISRWMTISTHTHTRTHTNTYTHSYPLLTRYSKRLKFSVYRSYQYQNSSSSYSQQSPAPLPTLPPLSPKRQPSCGQFSLGKYLCSRVSLHIQTRDGRLDWKFYAAMISKCRKVINVLQFLIFYRSPPRQWYVLAGPILAQNNITTVRRHSTGNRALWYSILFLLI